MRRAQDADNVELAKVLDALIASNSEITLRAIARRHPTLKNASDFSRNAARLDLIEKAKKRLSDARSIAAGTPGDTRSRADVAASQKARIVELEGQVRALVASHVACVRAVQAHGGMASLQRFWSEYKSIGADLETLGAMPQAAEVIPLKRR